MAAVGDKRHIDICQKPAMFLVLTVFENVFRIPTALNIQDSPQNAFAVGIYPKYCGSICADGCYFVTIYSVPDFIDDRIGRPRFNLFQKVWYVDRSTHIPSWRGRGRGNIRAFRLWNLLCPKSIFVRIMEAVGASP